MSNRPGKVIVTIIMDLLIVCAVAVTVRIGVRFSGQFAAQHWGKVFVAYTSMLVIPFGFHAIKTPYGGVFDVTAALTILVVLVVEWILEGVRTGD